MSSNFGSPLKSSLSRVIEMLVLGRDVTLSIFYWRYVLWDSAPARSSRTGRWPMRSVWTPWRTSWRKPGSSLRRLTRNTMRSLWWSLDVVWFGMVCFKEYKKQFCAQLILSFSIWIFKSWWFLLINVPWCLNSCFVRYLCEPTVDFAVPLPFNYYYSIPQCAIRKGCFVFLLTLINNNIVPCNV